MLDLIPLAKWLLTDKDKPETRPMNWIIHSNTATGETHCWIFDDDPRSLQRAVMLIGKAASDGELDWMSASELSHRACELAGAAK